MLVLVCGVWCVGKLQTLRYHEYNSASRHVERKQDYVNAHIKRGRVEGGLGLCISVFLCYAVLFSWRI